MAIHDIDPEGEESDDGPRTRQRKRSEVAQEFRAARTNGDWAEVLFQNLEGLPLDDLSAEDLQDLYSEIL